MSHAHWKPRLDDYPRPPYVDPSFERKNLKENAAFRICLREFRGRESRIARLALLSFAVLPFMVALGLIERDSAADGSALWIQCEMILFFAVIFSHHRAMTKFFNPNSLLLRDLRLSNLSHGEIIAGICASRDRMHGRRIVYVWIMGIMLVCVTTIWLDVWRTGGSATHAGGLMLYLMTSTIFDPSGEVMLVGLSLQQSVRRNNLKPKSPRVESAGKPVVGLMDQLQIMAPWPLFIGLSVPILFHASFWFGIGLLFSFASILNARRIFRKLAPLRFETAVSNLKLLFQTDC